VLLHHGPEVEISASSFTACLAPEKSQALCFALRAWESFISIQSLIVIQAGCSLLQPQHKGAPRRRALGGPRDSDGLSVCPPLSVLYFAVMLLEISVNAKIN